MRSCELIHEASLNERPNEWILCGGVQFTSPNGSSAFRRGNARLRLPREDITIETLYFRNKQVSDDKFSRIFFPSGGERRTMSASQITKCCHDWENFTFLWKRFSSRRRLRNETQSDLHKTFPSESGTAIRNGTGENLIRAHTLMTRSLLTVREDNYVYDPKLNFISAYFGEISRQR